jgi:predicted nucleic acid-binding protein
VAAYPEARAALAAARRAARISGSELVQSRRALDLVWDEIDEVELTAELARWAGDLAEEFALRGYDAVHLASLRALAGPDTVFVAADRRLLGAVRSLGVPVAPIHA